MVARPPTRSRSWIAESWDPLAQSLVRAQTPWTVHSVFRQAFNLTRQDGTLLGVVVSPAGNAPATLVLTAGPSDEPLTSLLTLGDSASVVGEHPYFLVVAGRLILDLSTAAFWDPPPVQRTLPRREIRARLRRAATVATSESPTIGLAPLLADAGLLLDGDPAAPWERGLLARSGGGQDGRAPSTIPSISPRTSPPSAQSSLVVERARTELGHLVSAIRVQNWPDALASARELSGLGPGLTPSGDDLLAGLALGLRAGGGHRPGPLQDALNAAVEGRTTDLAATRVRHATAGRADESVHSLLTALVSGPDDGLDRAVRRAVAYGHSSGVDTVVGLLVGLALGIAAPAPASPVSGTHSAT
jgi:uncharacterized protein DUF2877